MPKNPLKRLRRGRKKKRAKGSQSDDDRSVTSQISSSDASNRGGQIAGQSTASRNGDNDSVVTTSTGISTDPDIRKRQLVEKNASSKHNLGVFNVNKQNWAKAEEYLNIALEARKEFYGRKDGRVAETLIPLAEVFAVTGKKEEAIECLKKAQAIIKAAKKKPPDVKALNDPTVKKLDLDKLAETCVEKLEALGIKTAKFVRKNASKENASGAEVFGQDYEMMKTRERSLSDPDVFMQVMKTEDLNQDQINKGMRGLNNEIVDTEIYYSFTFDEEFSDVDIAPVITIVPQVIIPQEIEEDAISITDSDDSPQEAPNTGEIASANVDATSDEESKNSVKENFFFGGIKKTMQQIDKTLDTFEAGLTEGFQAMTDVVKVGLIDDASAKSDELSTSTTNTLSRFSRDIRHAQRVQRKRIKLHAVEKLSQGSLMFSNGDIFGAEKYYKKHMEEWLDILGYEDPSIISAKEDLGDIAFLTGHYSEAKRHYGLASRTIKRVHDGEPTNETVRLLEKLAMTNMKLKDTETGETIYNEAVDMANELKHFDTEIGSTTEEDALFHIASIYFKASNYSMAKATIAKIIRLIKDSGVKINPKVHNLIGMIYFSDKKYSDAKLYFEKAFQGTKGIHNFPKRIKVQILCNLGKSSNQIAMFLNALNYFEWAVEILESGGFCDFDKKTELISLYTSIGHSHFHLGNLDQAYDYYSKAYLIDINFFNNETSDRVIKLRLYIGVTKSHQGKYDDALWIFEEILYSQKRDDWPEDITVGKVLLDMSEIYFVCGSLLLSEKHQLKLSVSCCKRAFEIFNHHKLRSDHPYVKQGKQLKELMRQDRYGT